MLTAAVLQQLWPHGDSNVPGLRNGIVSAAPELFQKYGISDDLTIVHLMAQFTVECGGGNEMVENLNYSAQGLLKTWPSRFDAAKAAAFAHQPQKIANEVYNGRLGNAPNSNDGWTYRGRGLAQTTGKNAYGELDNLLHLGLVANPDLVNAPANALECGLVDFVTICDCLPVARADNVIEVSFRLNGGFIGFAERTIWLKRWKTALGVHETEANGMYWVQRSLNLLGALPQLEVDGIYGDNSKRALRDFQAQHSLKRTGTPNRATVAAIRAALPSA